MSRSLNRQWFLGLRGNNGGYTLVEVLVAVTILSIALIGVLSAISVSGDTQDRADNMAIARDIAITHIEECRAMTESDILNPLPNYSSPKLPAGNVVSVTTSEYPDTGASHFYRAVVTVTWPEANGSRSLTYETLLFKR